MLASRSRHCGARRIRTSNFVLIVAAVQDPNRARRSAANALTTKSSASAIASKLSRLLEEDKNIKQVTSLLC
jgi:hypothetical protein